MIPSPPECQDCARCCTSEAENYVRVTGDDYERLGEAAARLTHWEGHRCYMRMEGGACIALQYRPPSAALAEPASGAGRFECAVYGLRPEVCRQLERGSSQCGAELSLKL